jgi:hypothetical protein
MRNPESPIELIGRSAASVYDVASGKEKERRKQAVKKDQEKREAKAEKKREARGVEPTGKDFEEMVMSSRGYKNPTGGDYKKGGMVSASKRADGCAVRGKTKGRIV